MLSCATHFLRFQQTNSRHSAALSDMRAAFASKLLSLDHAARAHVQSVVDTANERFLTLISATDRRLNVMSVAAEQATSALRAQGQQLIAARNSVQGKLDDSRAECARLEALLEAAQQTGSGTAAHLQSKAAELQKAQAALDASRHRCEELESSLATLVTELKVCRHERATIPVPPR
jgi:chromosome segregation ATPase